MQAPGWKICPGALGGGPIRPGTGIAVRHAASTPFLRVWYVQRVCAYRLATGHTC